MDIPNLTCIVTPEEFKHRKQSFVPDEGVQAKYDALFAKYECFNTLIYHHKGNTIKSNDRVNLRRHVSNQMNSSHHHNHEKRTPKKTFTSLWNTLNESNYDKVSHKLKFMVNDDNFQQVIKELISMSIMHHIYRKQFLALTKDVMSQQTNGTSALHNTLSEFSGDYWLLKHENNTHMYDVFCLQQKHKHKVINTIAILMDISNVFHDIISIDDIWNRVCSCYVDVAGHDIYYLDILLNIILRMCETMRGHKHIAVHMMETLFALDAAPLVQQDMKIKFLKEKATQSLHRLVQ